MFRLVEFFFPPLDCMPTRQISQNNKQIKIQYYRYNVRGKATTIHVTVCGIKLFGGNNKSYGYYEFCNHPYLLRTLAQIKLQRRQTLQRVYCGALVLSP